MIATIGRRIFAVSVILALPVAVSAQEAVITGTVTDATAGVLPGVTVTAVHEATGNTFVAITNERGTFRIGARVGTFGVTFEFPGFRTITRSGLELLVGQRCRQQGVGTRSENEAGRCPDLRQAP